MNKRNKNKNKIKLRHIQIDHVFYCFIFLLNFPKNNLIYFILLKYKLKTDFIAYFNFILFIYIFIYLFIFLEVSRRFFLIFPQREHDRGHVFITSNIYSFLGEIFAFFISLILKNYDCLVYHSNMKK